MVAEPFQANEWACALDFFEFNEELVDCGIIIGRASGSVKTKCVAFVPAVVHGSLESDHHALFEIL